MGSTFIKVVHIYQANKLLVGVHFYQRGPSIFIVKGSEKTCHVEKTTYFHLIYDYYKTVSALYIVLILFSLNVQK